MIIHLNGWPGVGKKTIGTLLAANLGSRFIHNHLLHDVGIVCAGADSPDRWIVYDQVRTAAYSALRNRPLSESFVMTNGLCRNTPHEIDAWRLVVDLAIARQALLIPVVLRAAPEENLRRVQSAERVGKKLSDPEVLRQWFNLETIQEPDVPETLVLDVTAMDPTAAAAAIRAHIERIGPELRPASERHLRLR